MAAVFSPSELAIIQQRLERLEQFRRSDCEVICSLTGFAQIGLRGWALDPLRFQVAAQVQPPNNGALVGTRLQGDPFLRVQAHPER